MSPANSDGYDHATKMEANGGNQEQLERLQTAGGHPNDRTQPSLPVVHRSFANPAPLGLLSFATGEFLSVGITGVAQQMTVQNSILLDSVDSCLSANALRREGG